MKRTQCYGTMKKTIKKKKGVVIYQAKSGAIELRGDFDAHTIWATLDQIAEVFGRDKSVISRHLKNIFSERELDRNSVVAKNATTASDGKTYHVEYYNLDVVISVGYRVNSKTATQFRIWATKTLKTHILDGYTINRKRIAENYDAFMKAVADIQILLPEHVTLDPKMVLDLVKEFADTWLSLDAYDKDTLVISGTTKKSIFLTSEQLVDALAGLKNELLQKGETTDLFGQERQANAVAGIVGDVMQSFGGKALYPTVEEKAAHLLYFMVKNHPFTDGNKRSGAYAFIWFLQKAGVLDRSKITPPTLTALTLFIAESNPKNKERMIRLVLQLLRK